MSFCMWLSLSTAQCSLRDFKFSVIMMILMNSTIKLTRKHLLCTCCQYVKVQAIVDIVPTIKFSSGLMENTAQTAARIFVFIVDSTQMTWRKLLKPTTKSLCLRSQAILNKFKLEGIEAETAVLVSRHLPQETKNYNNSLSLLRLYFPSISYCALAFAQIRSFIEKFRCIGNFHCNEKWYSMTHYYYSTTYQLV